MDTRNSIKIVLLNHMNQLLLIGIDDKNITEVSGKYNGHFWQFQPISFKGFYWQNDQLGSELSTSYDRGTVRSKGISEVQHRRA